MMTHFNDNLPPDIIDEIRDIIGRKDIVTLKKMIKLEDTQGKKHDPISKVLVLTPYRCRILNFKSPFKLEYDFHFLDIKSIDSPSPDRLVIATSIGTTLFMLMVGSDDADHIIGKIALSVRTVFSKVPLSRIVKASLEPLGRQKLIQAMLNQADLLETGPCGNFSEMYRCLCDYLNVTPREDVQWDVDTIYFSQDCKELNLKDFNLGDPKEMCPILSVLMYNRWFEGLSIKDMKINSEVVEFILKVVRNSQNLCTLTLANLGLKCEFVQRLATNLIENKESRLEALDLSQNLLEDQGMIQIGGTLPLIKHGNLKRLNFSRTEVSPIGINGLCQSLRSSPKVMQNLTHLDLSGNCMKGHEAEELFNFLSSENHLTDLNLTGTDCAVEVCVSALSKGCIRHLENLHLGKNRFYGRKSKDWALPRAFQEFFRDTSALKFVDFSCIKYPPEALGSLFDGLLANNTVGLEIEVNLASCELRSAGCLVLQRLLPSVRNVATLDLSDNAFDSDLNELFSALQYNRSLKHLKIGRNFTGIKPRYLRETMEALIEMIQEEGSCLESVSLADSKIRDINTLLGCIGSNTSLTSLDVSGNMMGDGGARVLAKSLQINSRLRILSLDRNNLTHSGFSNVADALEENFTLRQVKYPVHDAVVAIKQHPVKTHSALSRIEDLLLRNAEKNRSNNEQRFRLKKAVSSTAQQVLDRMTEKVADATTAMEMLDADSAESDVVLAARDLVKDATSSKQLFSDIYGLAMEKSATNGSVLQQRLRKMAEDMEEMVQQHVKSGVAAMLQNAEAQCSHMFKDIKDELTSSTELKCKLPEGSIRDHVMETSGIEILNRVSDLNLAIASMISDKVTDSLLASLSHSNVLLEEQISKSKHEKEEEEQDQSPEQRSDELDKDSANDEDESLLPSMRKARALSVAKRRQRPDDISISKDEAESQKTPKMPLSAGDCEQVTVFFEANEGAADTQPVGDDKAMVVDEEEKIKQEPAQETDKKSSPTKDFSESSDTTSKAKVDSKKKEQTAPVSKNDTVQVDGGFPETVEAAKLDHVTKGRPRAPGKRQRRTIKRPPPPKEEDDFFQTNVSNIDFSQVPTLEEEEEIKRKERIQEKMASKKIPGMGMPFFVPGMVPKKKEGATQRPTDEDRAESEEPAKEKTSPVKRSVGAMRPPGMPPMGFGQNMFAEMKLKKLNKKSQEILDVKVPDKTEEETAKPTSPFGQSHRKPSESGIAKSPDVTSPRQNSESKEEFPFGKRIVRKKSEEVPDKPDRPVSNSNNNNNNSKPSKLFPWSKDHPDANKPETSASKPLVSTKPKPALKPKFIETKRTGLSRSESLFK